METFSFLDHFEGLNFPKGLSKRIDQSFETLAEDPWYTMEGAQRFRAMTKFRLSRGGWSRLADQTFFQSTAINRYTGGVLRKFQSIANGVPDDFLLSIARRQAGELEIEQGIWDVNVHQVRVQTSTAPNAQAFSTPEGIHQDGHDFIGMVLWRRTNAVGAVSQVYDRDRTLMTEATLERCGQGLLCNDREVFHAVTPFHSTAPEVPATRDVFIFDWNQATS